MPYKYGGQETQTFAKLPGFKRIVAWQAASDLAFEINQSVSRFGRGYYGLADQMRRAAISVSGNFAEGYCSGSLSNYLRYCNIARGSLGELGSYGQDCERWELLDGADMARLIRQHSEAAYLLDRLIQALIRKKQDGTWDTNYWVKESQLEYEIDSDSTELQDP
jgi:four helix bundle protein